MKKILSIVAILAISLALLSGCGSKKLVDGTYRAEFDTYDSHGWKEFVEITVSGGAITDAKMDGVNENGLTKSNNEGYKSAMEPVSGTYPDKFYPEIVSQYLKNKKVDDVTAVAGATNSSNSFVTLVTALQPSIDEGKTDVVIVAQPVEE